MKFPIYVEHFEELADLTSGLHLAIGMFDGVHLGHKAVIESAVSSARSAGEISGVLTFDPHPSRLFHPERPTRLIMSVESKRARVTELGVDIFIRKQFDHAFASITAEDFLPGLRNFLPSLKSIYIGENFRFGKKRAGSVATLIKSGNQLGIDVFSAERIKYNGEPISSTRVRKELGSGKIEVVNDLLGDHYCAKGRVISGAKLGRKIGFPTLNIAWSPECQPRFGVYHVRFRSLAGDPWEFGAANYGIRPTLESEDKSPLLEVHALNSTAVTLDDPIEVEWLRFIRPEQKFESVERLKEQIARDCEHAREFSIQKYS